MSVKAWQLPWRGRTVPHGLLDINRGCNITCDACYNVLPPSTKSLSEIEADLKTMLSFRQLASVSIVGGEVLLHPQLNDVVRLVKSYGLFAEMFTNGLLLDDQRLSELKNAGMDMIFVHIDSGQTRPDLAPNASLDQLRDLWDAKTKLIAKHGIDAGLTMAVHEHNLHEAREMVAYVVTSDHVSYQLITLFRDTENFAKVQGDLLSGLRGELRNPDTKRNDTLTNAHIQRYLHDEFNFRPFGYMGSNKNPEDPRWLSFFVAAGRDRAGRVVRHSMKASLFEKVFLSLSLRIAGRYPVYRKQSTFQLMMQLILNGISGGDLRGNMCFLLQCGTSFSPLRIKRVLFQCPAEIARDGSVTHCAHCPDAVVKDGKLVPVCIGDFTKVDP